MVDVQQAVAALVFRQRHLGEVDRGRAGAVVAVAGQLFRHLHPDIGLGLHRAAADMGGQEGVVEFPQRGDELIVIGAGLHREHVDGGAAQMAAGQAGGQGVDVHYRAAGGIDEDAAPGHLCQLARADHVAGGPCFRYVQADHVGLGQQLLKIRQLAGIAQRQLADDIVELYLHAQALGDDTQLHADIAVADDAQALAANFIGVDRGFLPFAAMGSGVLGGDAAQ